MLNSTYSILWKHVVTKQANTSADPLSPVLVKKSESQWIQIKLYFPHKNKLLTRIRFLHFPNSQRMVLQCGSTNYVCNPSTGRSAHLHDTLCTGFGITTRLHEAIYGNFPGFDMFMSYQQGEILWGLRYSSWIAGSPCGSEQNEEKYKCVKDSALNAQAALIKN